MEVGNLVPITAGDSTISDENLKKLRDQIEYYFNPFNFERDSYLQRHCKKDPEGYFPLEKLLKFNVVKSLTSNVDDIVKACYGSTKLTLNPDLTGVRPPPRIMDVNYGIVIRKFPRENYDTLKEIFGILGEIESIISFDGKDPESIEAVKAEGHYRALFINFKSRETPAAILAQGYIHLPHFSDQKFPVYPLRGSEIYDAQAQAKEEKSNKRTRANRTTETHEQKEKEKKNTNKVPRYVQGRVVAAGNLGTSSAIDFRKIKNYCQQFGTVNKVEYYHQDRDLQNPQQILEKRLLAIRFYDPQMSKDFLKKVESLEDKTEITSIFGGRFPSFTVLAGRDEYEYYKADVEHQIEKGIDVEYEAKKKATKRKFKTIRKKKMETF